MAPLPVQYEGSLLPLRAAVLNAAGLARCQSLPELGTAVVQAARQSSPAAAASLWFREELPEASWRFVAGGGRWAADESEDLTQVLEGLGARAEVQVWRVDGCPEPLVRGWMEARGIASLLVVPLLLPGGTRAVLVCSKEGPRWQFSAAEQGRLGRLCQQVAPFLGNLWLLERTREALTGWQSLRRGLRALRRAPGGGSSSPPELVLSSLVGWVLAPLGYVSWVLLLRGWRRSAARVGGPGSAGSAAATILRGRGVLRAALRLLRPEDLVRIVASLDREKVGQAASLAELLGARPEDIRLRPFQGGGPPGTWVCVPLVAGEGVVGALWAVTNRPQLAAGERDFLVDLGHHMGALWENACLQREAEERARRLAAINRLTHLIASSSDPRQVFRTMVREIRQVVPYDRFVIARVDEGAAHLVPLFASGRSVPGVPSGVPIPLDQVASAGVVVTGQPLLRRDIAAERGFRFDEGLLRAGLRSSIVLPLRAQERVLGVMMLMRSQADGFDEQDVAVLEPIAGHLALVLEKAYLTRRAETMAAHLEAVRRQIRLISTTADLDQVLRPLGAEIRKLVPYNRLLLAVLEPSKERVQFVCQMGRRLAGDEQSRRAPLKDTGLGFVLATGQPLIRGDLLQGPHFAGDEYRIRAGVRSALLFPLVAEGEAIGGMVLSSNQPLAYDQEQVAILEPVCEYLALALKSAQHLQTLRERQQRVEELLTRAVLAQERERQRVALDLHDSIAQWLVGALQEVRSLEARSSDSPPALASLEVLLQRSIVELRRILNDLHPPELENQGLEGVVRPMVEQLRQRIGVATTFVLQGDPPPLPRSVETTLYRMVQEALNNIAKHAGATHVAVSIQATPQSLLIEIADDGRGFDLGQALGRGRGGQSVGLRGLQERAELIQASLQIETAPGKGTRLTLELPLDPFLRVRAHHAAEV